MAIAQKIAAVTGEPRINPAVRRGVDAHQVAGHA